MSSADYIPALACRRASKLVCCSQHGCEPRLALDTREGLLMTRRRRLRSGPASRSGPESRRMTGKQGPSGTKTGFASGWMGIIDEIRVPPEFACEVAKPRWLRTQPVNRVLPLTLTEHGREWRTRKVSTMHRVLRAARAQANLPPAAGAGTGSASYSKNLSYRSRLILDPFTATDSTAGDGATHESRHDSEPKNPTQHRRVGHDSLRICAAHRDLLSR